jgi:hypothetical protein
LECEINSPSFDKSLTVPFPTENGTSKISGVECWRLAKGLRQTVVFALPARAFGKSRLEADEQIRVSISINDLLNKKSAGSDYELRLARDARHDGRSPDQDSAAE